MIEVIAIVATLGFIGFKFLTQKKIEDNSPRNAGESLLSTANTVAGQVASAAGKVVEWFNTGLPESLGMVGEHTLKAHSLIADRIFEQKQDANRNDTCDLLDLAYPGHQHTPKGTIITGWPAKEYNRLGSIIEKCTNEFRARKALEGIYNCYMLDSILELQRKAPGLSPATYASLAQQSIDWNTTTYMRIRERWFTPRMVRLNGPIDFHQGANDKAPKFCNYDPNLDANEPNTYWIFDKAPYVPGMNSPGNLWNEENRSGDPANGTFFLTFVPGHTYLYYMKLYFQNGTMVQGTKRDPTVESDITFQHLFQCAFFGQSRFGFYGFNRSLAYSKQYYGKPHTWGWNN